MSGELRAAIKSVAIPSGFEFWTVGERGYDAGYDETWRLACDLKAERERLRPDLLVRVSCVWVRGEGVWWVVRKEGPRSAAMRSAV